MSTTMHSRDHARIITSNVTKFKRGVFEDEIRFHTCGSCGQPLRVRNPLVCSGCKVIRYCNTSCQARDWKDVLSQPHQDVCKVLQKLPDREPQMREIALQFPWARLQQDGTFSFTTLRASRNLLGTGTEFGWWTEHPCCLPRDDYLPGFNLLGRQHLTERAGWKLTDKETPWLDFSFGGKPPKPTSFAHNWASYYEWRGLPIESPAALLLHWPLTVYRLLSIMGVIPMPPSETRRQLTVHMLGIEKEVDFLPVFGELALLLPNIDLNLVLFGPGVANVLAKAQKNPLCLAAQPIVFKYSAPKISGGGSIRISFWRRGSFWEYSDLAREGLQRPDAMVACNAGLSSYPQTWMPVVLAARAFAIPFAVTDYNEISLHNDVSLLIQRLPEFSGLLRLTPEERRRVNASPACRYDVHLNPFMEPGPRPTSLGGISAVNGYEMVICLSNQAVELITVLLLLKASTIILSTKSL
ncbi:hypothetical protein B0H19DRAFT_1185015 [Mycena capillaripes]|nr:hypothetical protein B0H19DRAFT_1185015 [Mycena capillaripes]